VFAAAGGYASPQQFSDGFAAALGACAGLSLLGALAGLVPAAWPLRLTTPTKGDPRWEGSS
jgi:hypothetical protein